MTNPANAASREARVANAMRERWLSKLAQSPEGFFEDMAKAAIAALADEAASQPREGVGRSAIAKAICEAMGDDPAREGPWDEWYSETPYAIAADHVLAALHDTAPTDQAQRGGEVERAHVLREIVAYYSNCEQGPGHCHDVPGIWDRDNPPGKAGTPCSWCATWQRARHLISTPNMPKGGEQ